MNTNNKSTSSSFQRNDEIYSLKKNDKLFKKISINDIFCVSKFKRLKYLTCAIKNQYKYLVANNTNNNSSIICIGYKKTKHDKCSKCCKCYCSSECTKIQCNYNANQDCNCNCICNKICSQFAISETFVVNENINDTVNRAINEEINMNFYNAEVVIDKNLYTYNNYYSGTIHNVYININNESSLQYNCSGNNINNVSQSDDKKNKALITIYGKTDILKQKIEDALGNTTGFSSNEKHIEYILIIPIDLLSNVFKYVQSIHTTLGTKIIYHTESIIKSELNNWRNTTQSNNIISYKKSKKTLVTTPLDKNKHNIYDLLVDVDEY